MKKMEKLSVIMLVLVMVLSLVSCGVSTENNSAQIQNFGRAVLKAQDNLQKSGIQQDAAGILAADGEAGRGNLLSYDFENKTPYNNTLSAGLNKTEDTATAAGDNVAGGGNNNVKTDLNNRNNASAPKGEYNKGAVLVKVKETFNKGDLGTLAYTCAEPLYSGSKWYSVQLTDADKTEEAVAYLTGLESFESVDYDYVMSAGMTSASVDVSGNPDYVKEVHHDTHKVPEGWQYITDNGKLPGGSSDVVVAVIDTGVDYNHLDLRGNIWVNSAEIPGNGIDDDGNGYVDDVYGWNFVWDNNAPQDDNGHGTHVAGIIAAENNDIGGVGVAYNCKVMVLKAGNSSGYFNNSDIAEAIQYAYMNGASVINMSFGGSNISLAVEDALESAYNSCILVAAAGNDGACNNLYCRSCLNKKVTYPAALPYVIGVMSTNHDGSVVSSFSNYDHNPYDSIEYEVYAVGEAIPSCWPGNKYAVLNGTSMAAPTVSGIAALLRSYYSDREVYSTKYIQSQIVNTGTKNPFNYATGGFDLGHSVTNAYEALTRMPKPCVNLYDYSIDDSPSISSANNGNGVIDAGETVRLYVSLQNRGGVAGNVNVSIDTNREEGISDPYFSFVNSAIQLSDIGTYSVRESGDKYFEIVVSGDCPNDYLTDFNIHYTYTNGMDDNDTTLYQGSGKATFNVSSGYRLPGTISEDTTFTADRLYIVGDNVTIPAGVTVTFEEGCRIQFYDDREYYNSPVITVYGTLNFNGSKDNMISIAPNERHAKFACIIETANGNTNEDYGTINVSYVNAINLFIEDVNINIDKGLTSCVKNSKFSEEKQASYKGGIPYTYIYCKGEINVNNHENKIKTISDSYLEIGEELTVRVLDGNYIIDSSTISNRKSFTNNIIITTEAQYTADEYYGTVSNNIFCPMSDNNLSAMKMLVFKSKDKVSDNTFSAGYQKYAEQVIDGYRDSSGNPTVDVYGSCSDITKLWPYVVSMELFDATGNPVKAVGKETVKVRVTFNRPMDTSQNTFLTFGTREPYGDYHIDGKYVSDTVWEGSYTLKAQIENGQSFLKVNHACAAEDQTKTVFGEYYLNEFTIDTTAAMSMNLFAIAREQGIELTMAQDDYDTLLGYNIYRSETKDGNFVRLNPAILLPDELTFLDENAEPGKTYWYTYTVVLTDFTESAPAGKVQATAMDTMAPLLYHTPVNQGYKDNNLVISCTASDNVAIASVTLYYRTIGSDIWKALAMSKVNDKYNATIFGSELTLDGIEYYIEASDGVNTVYKGSADVPYTVVIKDASLISRIGDVDGNGQVTTKDALMLIEALNGDLLLTDDEFRRADLNGDGQLSSAEALRILQYVNGKITTLEM